MISEDIKGKTEAELKNILFDKKNQLRKLQFNLVSGKVKDVREIRNTKKDIARVLTLLNNKK